MKGKTPTLPLVAIHFMNNIDFTPRWVLHTLKIVNVYILQSAVQKDLHAPYIYHANSITCTIELKLGWKHITLYFYTEYKTAFQ